MKKPPRTHRWGFTLIEVLVALGILAISLMAGLRAASSMTRNAERQWQVLLAQACADNVLGQLRLSAQLANVGEQRLACQQGSLAMSVVLTVAPTPNAAFRRVDAQVFDASTPVLRMTTVLGRY
jgi:general secretion pathway protein I